MRYRELGKTGLNVSEIGLGTAQLGGPSLVGGKYLGSPKIEKKEALNILQAAFDAGVNFFDSSDKYGDGEAERLLGEVFKGRRHKVIFATKCGITESGDRCFQAEYVRGCLENSLKNLNVDYIDVFQLTKPNLSIIEKGDIYDMLAKFKAEGKIRFSGISTGTEEETLSLIADKKVDTLQIFYNLLYVKPAESIIPKAYDAGIGLIIRSPLSSGLLTGKFNYDTKFSPEDDRSLFMYGKTLTSRIDMLDKIRHHFNLINKQDIFYLSLNYLLSNRKISTIIPGASAVRQLSGILELCNTERLTQELFCNLEDFIRQNYKE